MKPIPALAAALALALALSPATGLAHSGHAGSLGAFGLAAGFAHPLNGLDHVLAMVAVGLAAALRGGRAVYAMPLAFLGMMAVGAGLGALGGTAGPALAVVEAVLEAVLEAGITASVVVLGLLALVGRGLPVALLAGVAGLFALFHGYAHGTEMPETASGLRYGLGFLAGTALLHAAGLGLGALAVLALRPWVRDARAAPDV